MAIHTERHNTVLHLAAAMAVALLLRLISWKEVFSATTVRFLDNDSYYHAFRIREAIATLPAVPWFDSGMNHPVGATIIWPPLFDFIGATLCRLLQLAGFAPEQTMYLLPFLPVFLGVLQVPLMAALAKALFPKPPVREAAWLAALLPAAAHFAMLGRLDQHVAELLLFTVILYLFARGWQISDNNPALRYDAACGAAIATAFWNWQGSVLNLLVLSAITVTWYTVAAPREQTSRAMLRSLSRASACAALLLLVTVPLFAPAGAWHKIELVGITGFTIIASASVALYGRILLLCHNNWPTATRPTRACLAIASGVALILLELLLLPPLRNVVNHGLAMVSAGNAWYRNIQEFDPMFFAGFDPLGSELLGSLQLMGLTWFLMLAAIPLLLQNWRAQAEHRPRLAALLLLLALFVPLALLRVRFLLYMLVPLILCAAYAWQEYAPRIARQPWAGGRTVTTVWLLLGLLTITPTLGWYWQNTASGTGGSRETLITALEWLRREPVVAGKDGVLSEWDFGHLVRYFSTRPVLVNPFGTDLGPDGMRDAATFFLTSEGATAEEVLSRRKIGFVLLANPLTEACFAWDFAPAGTPRAVELHKNWRTGVQSTVLDRFRNVVPSRLYFNDAMAEGGKSGEALPFCRLVYESPLPVNTTPPVVSEFKIFEVVAGAKLRGTAQPGATVTAKTTVTTNGGRTFTWFSSVTVPASGTFVLRLPYATGANRLTTAGRYQVSSGRSSREVAVSPGDVLTGSTIQTGSI